MTLEMIQVQKVKWCMKQTSVKGLPSNTYVVGPIEWAFRENSIEPLFFKSLFYMEYQTTVFLMNYHSIII